MEGQPGACAGGTSSSCDAVGNVASTYFSSGGCCSDGQIPPCCSGINQCYVNCIMTPGANPNPSAYDNFLTITRQYPTNNLNWCTMGVTGTITIDGCDFDGDGKASHWANAINSNMSGCVTATSGTTQWGELWLGTSEMCNCKAGNLCSSNYHGGDNIYILSVTSTTCIIVGQPSGWWTLYGDISCINAQCRYCKFQEYGTYCACCSDGYGNGDTFYGTGAEPDIYGYVAKPAIMGPFVAVSNAGPTLNFS